jgi:hypothetical protein
MKYSIIHTIDSEEDQDMFKWFEKDLKDLGIEYEQTEGDEWAGDGGYEYHRKYTFIIKDRETFIKYLEEIFSGSDCEGFNETMGAIGSPAFGTSFVVAFSLNGSMHHYANYVSNNKGFKDYWASFDAYITPFGPELNTYEQAIEHMIECWKEAE